MPHSDALRPTAHTDPLPSRPRLASQLGRREKTAVTQSLNWHSLWTHRSGERTDEAIEPGLKRGGGGERGGRQRIPKGVGVEGIFQARDDARSIIHILVSCDQTHPSPALQIHRQFEGARTKGRAGRMQYNAPQTQRPGGRSSQRVPGRWEYKRIIREKWEGREGALRMWRRTQCRGRPEKAHRDREAAGDKEGEGAKELTPGPPGSTIAIRNRNRELGARPDSCAVASPRRRGALTPRSHRPPAGGCRRRPQAAQTPLPGRAVLFISSSNWEGEGGAGSRTGCLSSGTDLGGRRKGGQRCHWQPAPERATGIAGGEGANGRAQSPPWLAGRPTRSPARRSASRPQ